NFGYFNIWWGDIRADIRLLDIVNHVGSVININKRKFTLFGHSEGGQFVNRFVLAYPDRVLRAASGGTGSFINNNNVFFPLGLNTSMYALDLSNLKLDSFLGTPYAVILGTKDSKQHHKEASRFVRQVSHYAQSQNNTRRSKVKYYSLSEGDHSGKSNYKAATHFLFEIPGCARGIRRRIK
ncbi:MAG: hypothetical protein GY869_05200, partial [Planctomycetes bacterium]|nr:hypothetical protein [Planctomycetota bacterium]